MAKGSTGLIFLGIAGAAAYYFRGSWLPQAEAAVGYTPAPAPTGATGTSSTAPTTTTANQPVTAASPGAVAVGNQGCFLYPTGTAGSSVMTCPPGVNPPAASAPPNNCASGFTQDAAGICTRFPDAVLLAQLNSIAYTGPGDIPSEQILRIDPQILSMYSTTTGVTPGSVLAFMLGLGTGNGINGTIANGSDGYAYILQNGVFYKQGPSTHSTVNGVGARLGAVSQILRRNVPITRATLIMASAQPTIAALTGRDPRAMMTAAQWNALYTQATGIVQGIPLHPENMQGALMSAEQYQARRAAQGLQTTTNLGSVRTARRAAFPLGAIAHWVAPGNRTIYQLPGRGAVPAGRGGRVPNLGVIHDGGGNHRSQRSPFPRPSWWRQTQ
jgi:hypothetical protein